MNIKLIREVPSFQINDMIRFSQNSISDIYFCKDSFELLGSGKAALSIVLKYLRSQNILENKTSELLVPEWIGNWVYNQANHYAFTSKSLSKKTRAMLVYHQYGFPQNMDKICEYANRNNLKIIEDCAHTLDSYYKGNRLGSFGDFSIFSFSKFFFAFALGGIKYKDQEFEEYLRSEINNTNQLVTIFNNLSKLIAELGLSSNQNIFRSMSKYLTPMSYSLYDVGNKYGKIAKNNFYFKLENEILIRKKRYKFFIEQLGELGIIDHLDTSDVTPYVIPIKLKAKYEYKVLANLKNAGYQTGIYKFDTNRFFIEPNFENVLWIFLHSGMSDSEFEHQIEIVKNVIIKK